MGLGDGKSCLQESRNVARAGWMEAGMMKMEVGDCGSSRRRLLHLLLTSSLVICVLYFAASVLLDHYGLLDNRTRVV
jgi:hypothetical protein